MIFLDYQNLLSDDLQGSSRKTGSTSQAPAAALMGKKPILDSWEDEDLNVECHKFSEILKEMKLPKENIASPVMDHLIGDPTPSEGQPRNLVIIDKENAYSTAYKPTIKILPRASNILVNSNHLASSRVVSAEEDLEIRKIRYEEARRRIMNSK